MENKLTLETLAIGVAHAVYRNTEVEMFHSEMRQMDDALYKDVYRIVSEKAALLIKSIDLLVCANKNGMFEAAKQKGVPTQYMNFYMDVLFGIGCGMNWDAPRNTDLHVQDDIAEFLLGGVFRRYCDGKHIFDDTVMRAINQDIVDCAYCLLKHIIKS